MTRRTIADRFEIHERVGAGGMGVVYRALDRHLGATVAIKILHPGGDAARFAREVQSLRALAHPSIVGCVDAGSTPEGEPYLAMDWLEGEDLAARLAREGPLPADAALSLAALVADGLAAAHDAGIVHRDLKPANLFLCDRRLDRVKLLDFGIARYLAAGFTMTHAGSAVGSPGYMSPEQARGDRVDPRSDLFSLGAVLFEMLTGAPPFEAPSAIAALAKLLLMDAPRLRERDSSAPPELDALLARALAKEPRDRFEDARSFAGAMRALVGTARAAASTVTRPLSRDEQRYVTVVAAGLFDTTRASQPTLGGRTAQRRTLRLREIVGGFTDVYELLGDNGLLAVFAGDSHVVDQLERSIRCASAVEPLLARPVAVVTGRATLASHRPTGEAIDGAAALLARVPSERTGGVWVDAATGRLLGSRREVVEEDGGLRIVTSGPRAQPARRVLGREAPFVGRRRELAFLGALLDEAIDEARARVAVVRGEAGGGKSRLASELCLGAAQAHPRLARWTASAQAWTAGVPYELAMQLVHDALGLARDAEPQARVHAIREACERISEPWVAPLLGELAGGVFAPDSHPYLSASRQDANVRFDHLREAFARFVEHACKDAPLLLLLEDLHWGDRPSIALLEAALRRCRDRPLCVLALARPEIDDLLGTPWKELDVESITLAPIGPRAAAELVRQVLGDAGEALVDRLVAQAQGNAFFLEELVRAVAEGGRIEGDPNVLALVSRRLEKLDDDERRLLRAASVFGQRFELAALGPMIGAGASHVVDRLAAREILVAEGEWASFAHALVRDAAYATLTDADRRAAHRAAFVWEHERGSEAAVLAEHAERAANDDAGRLEAADWLLRAGSDPLDTVRSGDYVQRALALLERTESSPERTRLELEARLVEGELLRFRGNNRALAPRAEETARLAALHGGPEQRGAALRTLAFVRAGIGDVAGASDALARAAEELHDAAPAVRARLLNVSIWLAFNAGSPSEAREAALRAVDLARESGLVRERAASLHNAAEILLRAAEIEAARALHDEAVEIVERHGLERLTLGNDLLQGYLEHRHQGDPSGRARIQLVLERSLAKGQGWAALQARLFLALLDGSRDALRAVEEEARGTGQHGIALDAAYALARMDAGALPVLRP